MISILITLILWWFLGWLLWALVSAFIPSGYHDPNKRYRADGSYIYRYDEE